VAAGLITATGLKLSSAIKKNPLGVPVCVAFGIASFVGIALLRWPLAYVLLGLGGLACAMTYRKMGKAGA
jgi:chromate transporter